MIKFLSILLVIASTAQAKENSFDSSNFIKQLSTTQQADRKSDNIRRLDYEGFTIWLDCSKRGAVKFRYNAQRDTGKAERYDKFFLDPNVPKECQQFSGKAYGKRYGLAGVYEQKLTVSTKSDYAKFL